MAGDNEREVTVDGTDTDGETDTRDGSPASEAGGSPASEADGDSIDGESVDATSDGIDEAADSFLELEQELDTLPDGMQLRGQAIDVDRVPREDVPADFPAEIRTERALALTLELVDAEGERTETTYFEWPAEGTGDRLGRLLELRGVPVDRFADLHGERILLTVEDGHVLPVLPDERPRGDSRAVYGILAGLLPSLLVFAAGMFGLSSTLFGPTFVLLWLLATFVVLPAATYVDAWHLRTTTNWEGGPLFWTFFALVPGLNVVTTAAYLILRGNAEPLR